MILPPVVVEFVRRGRLEYARGDPNLLTGMNKLGKTNVKNLLKYNGSNNSYKSQSKQKLHSDRIIELPLLWTLALSRPTIASQGLEFILSSRLDIVID